MRVGPVRSSTRATEESAAPPPLLARLRSRLTGRVRLLVMYGVPAVAIALLLVMMLMAGRFQETENAYVQAARVPISTSVSGRIIEMRVTDNEQVVAGQVLFRLDRANPQADVAQFEAALASARARVLNRPALSSWDALLTYCHTTMAHRDTERFRILFLDRKNVLIADEEQARGTVDHVPVYPREVVKRALEVNASALILVHNHPSGDPAPSQADIAITRQIDEAARLLNIVVHDHIVIGRSREVSFRATGLL